MGNVAKMGERKKRKVDPSPPQTFVEEPYQFSLLDSTDRRMSKAYGLWEHVPWQIHYTNRTDRSNLLKSIESEFEARGETFRLRVKPALIEREGRPAVQIYPGESEGLIELIVRKMAVRNRALMLGRDGKVGLKIKLYDIYRELKSFNHYMTYPQIEESLMILHHSNIEITRAHTDRSGDPKLTILSSTVFPVMLIEKDDVVAGREEAITVSIEVNPLISESMKNLDFIDVNYETLMKLSNTPSRALVKRLNHDIAFPMDGASGRVHVMKGTELQKLCGMMHWKTKSDAWAKIHTMLKGLVERGILASVTKEAIKAPGKGGQHLDVVFTITVSEEMAAQGTNARQVFENNIIDFQSVVGAKPKEGWGRRGGKKKGAASATPSDQVLLDLSAK